MLLQLRKLVPKVLPTPPTLQIPLKIILVPPLVILRQRKVRQINKELRRKTIVMLAMLHTIRISISTEDMDM